ncbi:Rho GTPase activating protein 22 [Mycena kentingensis (nom. inval.)]|nr:Rho GTPase activating protein 22 [Mycena kentingensis (nom. inval.)]
MPRKDSQQQSLQPPPTPSKAPLTQFLSRPSKWFTRTPSASRVGGLSPVSDSDSPRPSTSSVGARKPKISRPTDPRPILDADGYKGVPSSRSVLDLTRPSLNLSSPTTKSSLDLRLPSSPSSPRPVGGYPSGPGIYASGDLRNASRRPWSKSADDLRMQSSAPPSPIGIKTSASVGAGILQANRSITDQASPPGRTHIRVDTQLSFVDKVAAYRTNSAGPPRQRADSLGPSPSTSTATHTSLATPASGSITGTPLTQPPLPMASTNDSGVGPMPVPFYARKRTDSERSRRSGKSALGDGGSPGSTPPSALSGSGGMIWPAMASKDATREVGDGSASPSSVSVSVSAPILEGSNGSLGVTMANGHTNGSHFHTRSHSFTPKLSSRLAGLGPSSPARKGSAGELDVPTDRDIKDKDRRGLFHLARPNPSSAPQIILEPASGEVSAERNTLLAPDPASNDGKRASQIVYATGFINRLIAPALSDPRSWKPFKMEVRGAKLLLHKPPNDRALGIRHLFATGIMEDDDEPVNSADEVAPRAMGSVGRKKRAYWGRGRHPALVVAGATAFGFGGDFNQPETSVVSRGKIEKGTMEALLHEAVFATVFLPDGLSQAMVAQREEEWRDFSLAILLSLPLLSGRAQAETELVRCAGYFVSGAQPEEAEAARKRVGWIAEQYLRLHGAPVDRLAWDSFCADTIPDIHFAPTQPSSGIPTSISTQAMFTTSPVIGESSPTFSANTFSPRPDTHMLSLLDVLGIREPLGSPVPPPRSPRIAAGAQMPWAALNTEGLSRSLLLAIDPNTIARSLTLFHRAVVEQTPDELSVSFVYSDVKSDAGLFGSNNAPHWLTKFVLLQVLGPERASNHNAGLGLNKAPQQPTTSRTHSRSEIIGVWAKVGELCRAAGDECTWRAILEALCSAPVARLDKVWRRVQPPVIASVVGWAQQDGDGSEVREPRVTAWGGDIRQRFREEVESARISNDDATEPAYTLGPMQRALDSFESFRRRFLLCPRRAKFSQDDIGEEVQSLVNFWMEQCADGGGGTGLGAKFMKVEQFMSLSLAAEPRRKGLFEPHYWTRAAQQTPYASLVPLLFPEVFPTSTLVDRSALLQGRVNSDTDPRFLLLDPHQQPPQPHVAGLPGLHQAGTLIRVYNGEVLLTVWHDSSDSAISSRPSSRLRSRPPSSVVGDGTDVSIGRAPSIRVKPATSQGLDRKTSLARRSSLPSPSQYRSFTAAEPSSKPPLRVRVLAGTLNWLVDILVHGLRNVSVSVADDNGEMSLREGKTRELVVDQVEFSKLWWNIFRCLVTPLVFFELLRKMYINTRPHGVVPSVAEFLYVAGIRTEVLDTIKDWLVRGAGAQDMLDEPQLLAAVSSFLDSPTEHVAPAGVNASDPGVEQAWTTLKEECAHLRRAFQSYIMRPPPPFPVVVPLPAPIANGQHSRLQNQTREPPELDRLDPEDLVDNLDAMAAAALSNVTQEDLFITSDLLEAQTADRLGWFLAFASNDELVEIQNMYSYLQDIEPSPLIANLGQDSLYRLLPPGVRSCIRAYVILRKWAVAQLVAPRLGLRARQSRMELLLRAIEVARRRSLPNFATSPQAAVDFACPRSFVEAVLTSAVLSVESRIHNRPWLNIAMTRGTQCDSIMSLLSQPFGQSTTSSRPLTLDVGWLLERMLEIIAAPDVMEPAQPEGQSLISFDKRRHLCNLISSVHRGSLREDVILRAFERLNNIEKDVWLLQFDHRGIREEALREGMSGPGVSPAPARRVVQPFSRIVALQLEKNKRDRTLRSRLLKERVQEQTKIDKREDQLTKAMQKQVPPTPQQKHQRSKKSMSAFLHFIRPISSAFGNDHSLHAPGSKRTPEELDFLPSGKPSLVISLVEMRATQFINNDRSFVFQLDSEDGGHYILQAVNKREMTKWLDSINRGAQTTAKRRLTYLGTPKPQISDHLNHEPIAPSCDPHAVFGVDIAFLLRREIGVDDIPPGTLPSVIERCLSEIEGRGLTEVGIYRLAGSVSMVNACKAAFNRGEDPIDESTDIHVVCDLVKVWFRVLPEPFFPAQHYHALIEATQMESLDARLMTIRRAVQDLPQPNFDVLKRIVEHLDRVADLEDSNQMTAESLSIVFSPGLLRPPQENFALVLANMGHAHKLLKALITHFHVIFDEDDEVGNNDEDFEDAAEELSPSDERASLEDAIEDDTEQDIPPTITADLDSSPLDFTASQHLLASLPLLPLWSQPKRPVTQDGKITLVSWVLFLLQICNGTRSSWDTIWRHCSTSNGIAEFLEQEMDEETVRAKIAEGKKKRKRVAFQG